MDALKMAVMWRGVGMLPRLRALSFDQLKVVCTRASEISGERVLHMNPDASTPTFELPGILEGTKLTGVQVIAVMVFGCFILCGEREEMCSSLVEAWPIREALVFSPTPVADRPEAVSPQELTEIFRKASRGLL